MKMKVINEGISSKSMELTFKIDTSNYMTLENKVKAKKGDLFLFQEKKIILINEDNEITDTNGDYIKLGETRESDNLFNALTKNKTKKIFLWNSLNYENNLGKVKPYTYNIRIMNYFTWKIFTFFCFLLI